MNRTFFFGSAVALGALMALSTSASAASGNCAPTAITSYIQVNGGNWQQASGVTVNSGDSVKMGPQPVRGGSWSWNGGGTSGSSREQTIRPTTSQTATVTYTNSCGATSTQNFSIAVNGGGGANNAGSSNLGGADKLVHMVKRNASGFAIDGNNGAANGQEVYLWSNDSSNINQAWIEVDRGQGFFSYKKANTEFCIDGGNGGANAQPIILWPCDANNENQHWQKIDVGAGSYRLQKRNATGYSIDGRNGGADAQGLYLWASDSNNQNQHWTFSAASVNGGGNGGNQNNNAANYTLQVGSSGNGSTSITGSHSYQAGTAVTIKATAGQGATFSGWSGAVTGNANPLTLTMNGNKSLTAVFSANSNNGNNGGNAITDGLKAVASFPVGVAVNAGGENNSIVSSGTSGQQQAVVFKHFDQMTAGNIMKMSYLHPQEGNFTFNQADDLVSLARSRGLDMHGHALIWHADYQVPGFMRNYGGDFAAMLKKHVQTIVTHFQGRVVSWDVVNEALADDGEGTVGNGLRSTVFSQKMGVNFIDQSFINARAADGNVDLFYNDYNIEANGQKTRNMIALVDGMRSRHVPITGVGFQMHVSLDWPSIDAIAASLKAIADRGLKVKISELDVSVRNSYPNFNGEAAARQKQRYHDIIATYMRVVPPAQRAGVTVWGVWDSDSWINQPGKPDWPLLFDGNFQPKPALQGFADALQGR